MDNRQRSTRPVPPEKTAIAAELRSTLKGKPTRSGFNRSAFQEFTSFVGDLLKIVLVVVLCVAFVFGGFGGGMLLGYISTAQPLAIADYMTHRDDIQTSFVYDINGNVISKLVGTENVDRIYVSITDVKDTYIDEAITSIEDERFYEHNGIDIKRIGSAVLSALANGGTATYGGSTITQQTVKLISGQDEHSTSRKVQEWFSAMSLEQDLSKEAIMELYINLAPMGNNYVGIQAAAQNYFGKNASELGLAECAFLAGLPKSPSYYNPLRESGRRNALRRMRIVLSKMYELEKITKEEYEEALNTELVFKSTNTNSATKINSYFSEYAVQEVINDLSTQRNISINLATTLVYNRGYHIYTTLEPNVQAVLDEAVMNQELFQSDPSILKDLPEKPQAGIVVINTQTGAIAGMQGGYGEKIINQGLNRATQAHRSPGSSIKPLIDYAPALDQQLIVPSSPFCDLESHFDPNNPDRVWPLNSDRSYAGTMTVRTAVQKSKNTIAVMVWREVGGELALRYLYQMGIDRLDEGAYPAQAIGAFTVGMTPLEMAGAYNTLAAGGKFTEPYAYTQVLDSSGQQVMGSSPDSYQVFTPETAFLMTSMLQDVNRAGGTAASVAQPIYNNAEEEIPAACKTGTTDDNLDKWFCGYTPYYTCAVWYGYDNRLKQTVIPEGDRRNAIKIWFYIMTRIHGDCPGTDFTKPDTIEMMQVCTTSNLSPTEYCEEAQCVLSDYFVVNSHLAPTEDRVCPIHTPTPTPEPDPNAPVDDGTGLPPPPPGPDQPGG